MSYKKKNSFNITATQSGGEQASIFNCLLQGKNTLQERLIPAAFVRLLLTSAAQLLDCYQRRGQKYPQET